MMHNNGHTMTHNKKSFAYNQRVVCAIDSAQHYGKVIGVVFTEQCLSQTWIILLDRPLPDGRTGVALHESLVDTYTMDMALTEVEKQMVHEKDMMGALKALRRRTHCSLHDAKDAVEHYRAVAALMYRNDR